MDKVVCHHCGLPFKAVCVQPGRRYFYCSGCAIASRVPVDANGKFPVNTGVVTALAVGFTFFNQLLFWLLAVLLVREERLEIAGRFAAASLIAGVLIWIALIVVQWRMGARRTVDGVVLLLTLGLAGTGVAMESPACVAAGNAALVAWGLRGLLNKKTPKISADGG